MNVWAVVVAAGSGTRYGGAKQYEAIGAERVIDRSLRIAGQACDGVVVVIPSGDTALGLSADVVVGGGATRSESVRAGLSALPPDATHVLIHDAARPMASAQLYGRVIDELRNGAKAVIPGVAVTDTIKRVSASNEQPNSARVVVQTVDRNELVAVQTPQGFDLALLLQAHQSGDEATDDAALMELSGVEVQVIDGEETNRKITSRRDLAVLSLAVDAEATTTNDGASEFGATS